MRREVLAVVAVLVALLLSGCATNRPVEEQVGDAALASKVKAKLAGDPEVNPFNVDVDVLDGVVTLRGRVAQEEARREAEKLARDTRGVVRVVNEIEIGTPRDPGERVTDNWIRTKIKSKLAADPQLNPFNIGVDVKDGVVTLTGVVETDGRRQEAETLALDTRGVVRVRNELRLRGR